MPPTLDLLINKFALTGLIASQLCCQTGSEIQSKEEFKIFCLKRTQSAASLTSRAANLTARNKQLTALAFDCEQILEKLNLELNQYSNGTTSHLLAENSAPAFKLEEEVDHAIAPRQAAEQFSTLLNDYDQARSQYMQHRQDYDLHVKEFHQQAKKDNRQLLPLEVPQVKALAVSTEDACSQLQQFEMSLKQSETELIGMIDILQKQKGKIAENVYFQEWLRTQTAASNVQERALQFNRGVTEKGLSAADRIHQATQAANVSGDYVQSKNTFGFIQRETGLQNEETRRAQLHSNLASLCLIYVNVLNPNPGDSTADTTITSDQLLQESGQLQTEYTDLQGKYSAMEKASPSKK